MDECHSDSDDEISVGCPSPRGSVASNHPQGDQDKNCSLPSQSQDSGGGGSKSSGVRSFSILDILSHCPDKVTRPSASAEHPPSSATKSKSRRKSLETPSVTIASHNPSVGSVHFVRPWDYSHFYGFPLHPATGSPAYIPPFSLMHHHPPGVSLQSFNPRFNLNVGLTASASAARLASSPASSASQYSDTDTDADDVSTCGSRASASPLMTSRLSHQSSANDPSALNSAPGTATTGHRNDKGSGTNKTTGNGSPLDALFQMTSKTFEGVHGSDHGGGQASQNGGLFNSRQQMKKKRKSRTAFTNHQIFELEKRFLYQKYLSPADRDEIALSLGLTNAQVITWFQNRRAKLKRDMEELKKDVESAKILASHKGFVGSMAEMTLLQKRADDYKKALSASE